MKNQFKIVPLFTLVSLCTFISSVKADQAMFRTSFYAVETIGEQRYQINTDESVETYLPLPMGLQNSDWRCKISPKTISDDGKRVVQFITCIDGDTIITQGATCLAAAASSDSNMVTISSVKGGMVNFLTSCATVKNQNHQTLD